MNLTLVKRKGALSASCCYRPFPLCSKFRDQISWTSKCHLPASHPFPGSHIDCYCSFDFCTHLYDSTSQTLARMWPLPSGSSPLLGAPVCWGFHQGLGDDSCCLLCSASMETTKPQERKRTILRSKGSCGLKQYPTPFGELHFIITGISPILMEVKIYSCTCEQQSVAMPILFSNLPIPPERWLLHKETVVPISALKVVAFFYPGCCITFKPPCSRAFPS